MSFGKMNKFIEIKSIQNVKWANRTTFTEATDLFIIRAIPGTKLSTDMTILCDDENFEITSIEDVKGKNMYIEILAKKVIQNG